MTLRATPAIIILQSLNQTMNSVTVLSRRSIFQMNKCGLNASVIRHLSLILRIFIGLFKK